jgi:hypothetical protein
MKLGSWLILSLTAVNLAWAGPLPKTGGNHPTVKIQVESSGHTINEAKTAGFHDAIEQVVGTVVTADKEAKNDTLVKNKVGSYSAGYIDDYEIIESWQEGELWYVKMTVSVASSKIANRMLAVNDDNTLINGQRLEAQLESQLEERQQGDVLIGTVLNDYPYRAFVINSGQTEVGINKLRAPYVDVPYSIQISKLWLEALNEALTTVAVESDQCSTLTMVATDTFKNDPRSGTKVKQIADRYCGSAPDMRIMYKKTGDWMPRVYSYYFQDWQTLMMINQELQPTQGRQHVGLRVSLLDAAGDPIDTRCTNIDTELLIRYSEPNMGSYNLNERKAYLRPDIVGQNAVHGILRVNLTNLRGVEDLAKIRLNIEKTCI